MAIFRGVTGHHAVEWVATLVWNRWPSSRGMGGHHAVESMATMPWNTHKSQIASINRLADAHERLQKAQRTRDMAPPSIGPGNIAYDKFLAERMDARAKRTRGMAAGRGIGDKTFGADDSWARQQMESMDKVENKALITAKNMENAFSGWANNTLDTFNEWVWGAEKSFNDVLESFGKMLTKMMIKKSILQPATNAFGSAMSGMFSGGQTGTRASGGPVGAGSTYLVGEKGPELLHMGNQSGHVTSNDQIGGGNEMEVNVYANQQPEVKRSRKANGGERLDVIFDEQMAKNIGNDGKTARVLETKYGLSPQLSSR